MDGVIWGLVFLIIVTMIVGGSETEKFGTVLLGILFLLIVIIYSFVLLSQGKSYGKWLLGMRVYHTGSNPAGFFIMLVRETIGKFISGLIFSLGYLWLLWDADRHTWHDKFANTVVMVRERR